MPKTGRRRLPIIGQARETERRDAARNRVRILEAARALLTDRPIHDICMDELARAAGVGKGTLYRRFADRASLCRALLHDESARIQNSVLTGLGLPIDAPWLQRIERFLDQLFDYVHDNAPLLSEALAFERGKQNRFDNPAYAWQRQTVALYLSKATDANEIAPLDAPLTAAYVLSGLDPDLMQWQQSLGFERAALKTRFARFWRSGVIGT